MTIANPENTHAQVHLKNALAASEARFHTLVENSPDAILVADTKGDILYVNPEAIKIFGRSESRLIGKNFGYPITEGKATEIEVHSPGKTPIVAEMRVATIDWEGKNAFMCSIRDLSERVKLVTDLKRSNNDLNNFAEVVSQDIRTPLQNIGYLATWIKDDHSGHLHADAIDDVRLIIAETERMQKMLETLLSYSKLSSYQKMDTEVSMRQVVDDALENLSVEISRSGADVTVSHLPILHCNPRQMVTAFQHLISNAIKHCHDKPRINVSCVQSTDSSVFSVSDNGIGIAHDRLKSIFLPFNQLNAPEGRLGVGVGLATCKKIIERHSGKIWLKSQVNAGSTFFIQLPMRSTS